MLGELLIGLSRAADAGARGDIVENERDLNCVGDDGKMAYKAVLRGFVVVRRDGEQRVNAGTLRGFGKRDRGGGVVCAAACDDGNAAVDDAHAAFDECHALVIVQRCGFSGRAADNDGVGAALDLTLNKAVKGVEVDAAGAERRDDGDGAAGEDAGFHKKAPFCGGR